MEVVNKAEAMECCFPDLILMACAAFFFFFYSPQDYLPMGGTAHSELGPPTSTTNQEDVLGVCPKASLMEAVAQPRLPLLEGL